MLIHESIVNEYRDRISLFLKEQDINWSVKISHRSKDIWDIHIPTDTILITFLPNLHVDGTGTLIVSDPMMNLRVGDSYVYRSENAIKDFDNCLARIIEEITQDRTYIELRSKMIPKFTPEDRIKELEDRVEEISTRCIKKNKLLSDLYDILNEDIIKLSADEEIIGLLIAEISRIGGNDAKTRAKYIESKIRTKAFKKIIEVNKSSLYPTVKSPPTKPQTHPIE